MRWRPARWKPRSPGGTRRDEIGAMARSAETFRAGLLRAQSLEVAAEAERHQ